MMDSEVNWSNPLQFERHLGGNFWLLTDGRIYNTTSNVVTSFDKLPPTMKYKVSCGRLPVYEYAMDFPTEEGVKFVVFDIVTSFKYSKSGKTQYAVFEQFDYINNGWAKVNDRFKEYKNDFCINCAYAIIFEVNNLHPNNLKIIKKIKLNGRENSLEKTNKS